MTWRDASQHITDNHLTFEGFSLDDAFISGWTRALAAAPVVDGWVWCEHNSDVWMDEECALCHDDCCNGQPCPGPHQTLLLGSEVDA